MIKKYDYCILQNTILNSRKDSGKLESMVLQYHKYFFHNKLPHH